MKENINKEIIDLILKKKKGVTAATAARAYNRIREALATMEEQDEQKSRDSR